ncbi:MAG: hypothetical protein M5U09_12910 [Gammaproteobacteria bacterium]|nr:hypothetical protein [Gammaproteobacteria bacterium]
MKYRAYRTDPFIDLLFNALLGFTMLFFIAIVFMNPEALKARVNLKAEYIISVTGRTTVATTSTSGWRTPTARCCPTSTRRPAGCISTATTEGDLTDTIEVDGREVVYPINQEIVTIRGIIEGEYTVNLYYYEKRDPGPLDVTVRIDQVNPALTTVFAEKVTLTRRDEEVTVVRFTPSRDGGVTNVNKRQRILTPYALDPAPWRRH